MQCNNVGKQRVRNVGHCVVLTQIAKLEKFESYGNGTKRVAEFCEIIETDTACEG